MNTACPTPKWPEAAELQPVSLRPWAAAGWAEFSLRPFGSEGADLDFDFVSDDRPSLVTNILAACVSRPHGPPLDAEEVWSLPVSHRIECLLRLAAGQQERLTRWTLQCPRESCRQALEIELPLGEILAVQRRAEAREWLEWQDACGHVRFRRPTGNDQRRWRAEPFADPAAASHAMIRSLVVEGEPDLRATSLRDATDGRLQPRRKEWLSPDTVASLDSRLEDFDPLVAFSVRGACPHCNVEADFPVDLEALALGELERVQRQLLQDVHTLATRYHWSETDIIGLDPKRRARYLRLIDAEEVR